jgi:hypothetical protein
MAIEFNKRAVDIAVKSGILSMRKIGIKIKAAPTPAMVNTVVNIKVITAAIRYVNISGIPNFLFP